MSHLSASYSATLRVLLPDSPGSFARACQVASGGLSRIEWQRYLPELAYRDTCAPAGG